MPKVTWEEVGEVIHTIKNDRTILTGVINILKNMDNRLKEHQEKMEQFIHDHTDEDNGGAVSSFKKEGSI